MRKRQALWIALGYAAAATAWITFSDLAVEIVARNVAESAWLSMAKGFAFVAATSALLYFVVARDNAGGASPGASPRSTLVFGILLILGALAAVVLLGVLKRYEGQVEREYRRQVAAVADSKARQVETWIEGRVRTAAALAVSPFIAEEAGTAAATGRAPHPHIGEWLARVTGEAGFDGAILADSACERPLAVAGGLSLDAPAVRVACRHAVQQAHGAHAEFVLEGDLEALYFSSPVGLGEAEGRRRTVVIFRADPRISVYPLLGDSPVASMTGEVLLAHAAGEQVHYLGPLRNLPESALRLPVAAGSDLLAAHASRGAAGSLRGTDYRGMPVFAELRPVAGTDWTVIAKIDQDEVSDLAGGSTRYATYAALLVLATVMVGGVLAWRAHASAAAAREQRVLADLGESERRENLWKAHFFEMPFLGMAVTPGGGLRPTQFNEEMCRLLGRTREEVAAVDWAEVTHPDDRAAEWELHQRIAAGEIDGYRVDKRFLRPDGSVVYVSEDLKAERDAEGRVSRFIAAHADITERVERLKAITRLRDLYDLLSQANQAIVRAPDRQALFDAVVREAVERGRMRFAFIGFGGEDGIPRPAARYGDDAGFVDEALRLARALGPPEAAPPIAARATGRRVIANDFLAEARLGPWHEAARRAGIRSSASFPIRHGGLVVGTLDLYAGEKDFFDGDVAGILEEMVADLSFALDFIATREELEANRRLLQDLIDASDAIFYAFDAEGRCVLANRRFREIVPPPKGGDFIGHAREDMMPADVAAAMRAGDLEVFRSGRPLHMEESHPSHGVNRRYQTAKFPIRGPGGAITAVGGVSVDITEISHARETLAAMNRALEARVAERTMELVVARDRAQSADRLKSLFLATVSHELRTPLNAIVGFTSVLLQGLPGPLNEEQSRQLGFVRSSARQLQQLIGDVLDLSRIEAGELALAPSDFDLHEVVREGAEWAGPQAAAKGLAFALACAPGAPFVRADRVRVRQVLDNLLANAIKFTAEGSIAVETAREAGRVRIVVADTGIGIAASDREQLFQAFGRIAPDPAREGSGLGLAIAKRLVVAMGGEIGVESVAGRGSRFWFTLPAAAGRDEDSDGEGPA